ncbi:MAG TPA: hypothetical protein VMS18_20135 [Candidatus Binatia bacterium]|nr:hypothetical protein [Candidatus Binatia bacterium]
MTLTRKQCADLLGISLSTFQRRVAKGIYGAGTKIPNEKNPQMSEVLYSYSDLGLPEPGPMQGELPLASPEPLADNLSATVPTLGETSPTSNVDLQLTADLAFAEKYKRGEATDSFGNSIGCNPQVSALGPIEPPAPQPRILGDEHMPDDRRKQLPLDESGMTAHAGSDDHPLIARRTDIPKPVRRVNPNQTRAQMVSVLIRDCLYRGFSR